jgi:hypothetical protein
MKLIVLIALCSIVVCEIFAASVPVEGSCRDLCGEDFDEVVCASNGDDLLNFMGRCRLAQFNKCFDESKL